MPKPKLQSACAIGVVTQAERDGQETTTDAAVKERYAAASKKALLRVYLAKVLLASERHNSVLHLM